MYDPNQIWQDHRPHDYNQTVRNQNLPYLLGSHFSGKIEKHQ